MNTLTQPIIIPTVQEVKAIFESRATGVVEHKITEAGKCVAFYLSGELCLDEIEAALMYAKMEQSDYQMSATEYFRIKELITTEPEDYNLAVIDPLYGVSPLQAMAVRACADPQGYCSDNWSTIKGGQVWINAISCRAAAEALVVEMRADFTRQGYEYTDLHTRIVRDRRGETNTHRLAEYTVEHRNQATSLGVTEIFRCKAASVSHAVDQCRSAYPDTRILNTVCANARVI